MGPSYRAVSFVICPTQFESPRMSESPCTSISPLPEALPSSSCLLPDEHAVSVSLPIPEAVPACAVALDLPLPQPPAHHGILPPQELFIPESVDGHMPEAPLTPLSEPGVLVSPHSRSPSPTHHSGYIECRCRASPPVPQCPEDLYEKDDHFIRRWQQW